MKNDGPKIRIKECMEDWEERELGDITESYSGGTPSVGNKSLYGGTIPFIRSAEINSEITELFLTKDGLKNSSAKMVEKGNILYALYGATSGEVGISKIEGAINQAILCIKPTLGNDSYFIYQWLLKNKKNILKSFLQGGQGNLSGSIVKKFILSLPIDKKEQKKIGLFCKNLDDTISLHQQELDALKQTKQGFLQKMFPNGEETLPTIRFDSFVETWKQDEFGKVIKLVGGATPLKENKEYWIGDIVWLSSQEIKNKYVSKGTYTISEKAVRDNRTKVVPLGTPLIVTRSGILAKRFPISISSNEVAINQDIKALIFDKTKIDTEFIVAQIKAKESYILNNIVKTGTTVQSVNLPDLNRMILHIPEYEEQVKIGEFFRQLDKVVEIKEQELEALKQTKKGFLQKMFV